MRPRVNRILSVLLILTVVFSLKCIAKARYGFYLSGFISADESLHPLARAVPTEIRIFLADYLWATADEFHHFSPSRYMQKLATQKEAQDLEIIPLLQAIVILHPANMEAFKTLGQIQAFTQGKWKEAIATLQTGILANLRLGDIHQLYAQIALVKISLARISKKSNEMVLKSAIKYLDKAIAIFSAQFEKSSDFLYNPANYHTLKAAVCAHLGQFKNALDEWKLSGSNSTHDLLGIFLTKYEKGEPLPPSYRQWLEKTLAENASYAEAPAENESNNMMKTHEHIDSRMPDNGKDISHHDEQSFPFERIYLRIIYIFSITIVAYYFAFR